MNIGDKTTRLNRDGLIKTAKNVNILRNLNFNQEQFKTSFGQGGVDIELKNPYNAQIASFTAVQRSAPSASYDVELNHDKLQYFFQHTEGEAEIIIVRGGWYFVHFFFTISWNSTSGGPVNPKLVDMRCALYSDTTHLEKQCGVHFLVPGIHKNVETALGQRDLYHLTDQADIDANGDPVDPRQDYSFYQTGSASTIIDVNGDLTDGKLKMKISPFNMIGQTPYQLDALGTGMTIVGPISPIKDQPN